MNKKKEAIFIIMFLVFPLFATFINANLVWQISPKRLPLFPEPKTQSCFENTPYRDTGKIMILGNVVCENKDLKVDYPIEVSPEGGLTLKNTKLRLNGGGEKRVDIHVQTLGSLHILDDSSVTIGDSAAYRYSIIIEEGAVFVAQDSFFEKMGNFPRTLTERGPYSLDDSNRGLEVYADNAIFERNTVELSYAGGHFYGDRNIVRDNHVERTHKNGFVFIDSNNSEVSGNYLLDVRYPDGEYVGDLKSEAIMFENSHYNTITDNVVDDTYRDVADHERMVISGIALYNSTNNLLERNKMIAVHVWAFDIRYSDYNTFLDNEVVTTYGDGILLTDANYNTITNYKASTAEYGIFNLYSSYNEIKNVIVKNARELTGAGLRISGGWGNDIENYTVHDSDAGVMMSSKDIGNFFEAKDNHIKDLTLNNVLYSFSFDEPYGDSSGQRNNTFENVVENSYTQYSILSTESDDTHVDFINSPLDLSKINADYGDFSFYYFLDVEVKDSLENPLGEASVSLSNSQGEIFEVQTDSTGKIPSQKVLYQKLDESQIESFGPFTLIVSKDGYTQYSKTINPQNNIVEMISLAKSNNEVLNQLN